MAKHTKFVFAQVDSQAKRPRTRNTKRKASSSILDLVLKTLQVLSLASSSEKLLVIEGQGLFDSSGCQVRFLLSKELRYLLSLKARPAPNVETCLKPNKDLPSCLKDPKRKSILLSTVVILYFKLINPFQPLVSKEKFDAKVRENTTSPEFLALYYSVCLSGVGLLPTPQLIKPLISFFKERSLFYLKQCYNRPHVHTIQSLILLSQYTANYQYLGLALRMAHCLGIPHLSREGRNIYWILLWNERIQATCSGRPIAEACTIYRLPKEPYLREIAKLAILLNSSNPEPQLHAWFRGLPLEFRSINNPDWIQLPHSTKIFANLLYLYYFAILADINKPNASFVSPPLDFSIETGLSLIRLKSMSPLTKCQVAARFGSAIVSNLGPRFQLWADHFKWWCCLRLAFIHQTLPTSYFKAHLPPIMFLKVRHELSVFQNAIRTARHRHPTINHFHKYLTILDS